MGNQRLLGSGHGLGRLSGAILAATLVSAACMRMERLPDDPSEIPDAVPKHESRSRYGNPPWYSIGDKVYTVLASADGYVERGVASWYGPGFHGRRASSGEPYDMYAMTAAHPTLPLPTYVKVTNLENGKTAVVKVNDRGPFKDDRLIDLSYAAAQKLGVWRNGTALVEVRTITPAGEEESEGVYAASTSPAVAMALPATPPLPSTPSLPSAYSSSGDLYLQVGAFSLYENAYGMRDLLAG